MLLLGWIGERARWVMAIGVIAAMFVPALSAALRPVLPGLVAMVFALAVARLDLRPALRRLATPRGALRILGWTGALLVLTPAAFWLIGRALGLAESEVASLVYTGAAPPIMSSAALCLMLGLNGLLALEITVAASLLTPLIGPAVARLLLGEAVPLDALTLGLRVAAMIGAGTLAGLGLRRLFGPERIAAHKTAFDGIAALAIILFVIPLFDGVGPAIAADPLFALRIFALACAANLGVQIAIARLLRGTGDPATAGAAGLLWGNRTVAIYVAALPPDPVFTLYVALFQIPMLFTPLLMRPFLGR